MKSTPCSNFDELIDLYGIMAALYAKFNILEGSIVNGCTSSAFLAAVLLARALSLSALFLQLHDIDLVSELPIFRKSIRIILTEQ